VLSETPTGLTEETGYSKDGKPQRKKSTIRDALGKLFGRRKKTPSQDSSLTQRISTLMGSAQHRKCFDLVESDPFRAERNEGDRV
jgi:hypothetical protein